MYQKTVTASGLCVITEKLENVHSTAFGIFFDVGARDEKTEEAGASHFLEHMMFKGTESRTAFQIAQSIEAVGGYMNAFTGKEMTAYYSHLLGEHLPLAADVIGDMVSKSLFAEKEINREKGVVLEEISTTEDTPEEVVHEDFSRQMFPEHSLGKPVLGTRDTVLSFNHDSVAAYCKDKYTIPRAIVVATGQLKHDEVVKLVDENFDLPNSNGRAEREFDLKTAPDPLFTRKKDIIQAHTCIGTRGIKYNDDRKYAYFVMNTILGAGMSSRLFQSVREKHGLAYSVYSFHEAYADTGIFGVYAGTEVNKVEKATELIHTELNRLTKERLTSEELQRAKDQLKGSLVLGLESTTTRMHRLAKLEMYTNEFMPIKTLIEKVNKVTKDDVIEIAQEMFSNDFVRVHLLPNSSQEKKN